MRVLAIDTALGACAAAVFDSIESRLIARESVAMARGHAEALIPLVARVMQSADLVFRDIDRIVVTTGPGSFTGLRVGIAAARGLGVASDRPVIGVSTLAAYAAPYLDAEAAGPVVAAVDARHAHVYLQVFGPDGRTLVEPRLAPLSEAARAAAAAVCIVGSAARAVADNLPATVPRTLTVDDRAAPDIAWVAQIGAVLSAAAAPPKPLYLRAPDAQPQNAAQLPRR